MEKVFGVNKSGSAICITPKAFGDAAGFTNLDP
jgi:hypothetical protein